MPEAVTLREEAELIAPSPECVVLERDPQQIVVCPAITPVHGRQRRRPAEIGVAEAHPAHLRRLRLQHRLEHQTEIVARFDLEPHTARLVIVHPDSRVHEKRLRAQNTLRLGATNLVTGIADLHEEKPAHHVVPRVHVRPSHGTAHPLELSGQAIRKRRLRDYDDVADRLPRTSRDRQATATGDRWLLLSIGTHVLPCHRAARQTDSETRTDERAPSDHLPMRRFKAARRWSAFASRSARVSADPVGSFAVDAAVDATEGAPGATPDRINRNSADISS